MARRTLVFLLKKIALAAALILFSAGVLQAHPFGGVFQKTCIYPMDSEIIVDYRTHIGQTVLISLYPDKDGDGSLSEEESAELLERLSKGLLPNLSASLDGQPLTISETDRALSRENPASLLEGVTLIYTLTLPLDTRETLGKAFRFMDGNFSSGQLDRLEYCLGVTGDTGGGKLLDGGRGIEILLGPARAGKSLSRRSPDPDEKSARTPGNNFLLSYFTKGRFGLRTFVWAVIGAFILGAVHALSPGHGKSMVAAYLVGSGGKIPHAVILGLIVTLTHVASVILLGIAALCLSEHLMPQQIMPWIGGLSGGMIFFIGYWMLAKKALHHISHSHGHDHGHHHHGHHHHGPEPGRITVKGLLSMGIAGGIMPCPTALVVVLLSLSFSRVGEGLALILFFSLGLSSILILIGILTVRASTWLENFSETRSWIQKTPVFSAGVIMIIGVGTLIRSVFM